MLDARQLIQLALAEDFGEVGDVTTAALVPPDARATAHFVNRKAGVIAGLEIIGQVFSVLSSSAKGRGYKSVEIKTGSPDAMHPRITNVECIYHIKDGDMVAPQTKLCTVIGSAAEMLTGERTALNFISHLSGIATATHALQQKIVHTKAKVCDTRKTTPGLRALEKYAVTCGGGANYRMGLFDMIMIKDNHIVMAGGDIDTAVAKARAYISFGQPNLTIAVEVENLEQLRAALTAGADRIMLDNMDIVMMREGVAMADSKAVMEATGGITADNIVAVAETGVDFISVGAITHSAPVLDIGLDFAEITK